MIAHLPVDLLATQAGLWIPAVPVGVLNEVSLAVPATCAGGKGTTYGMTSGYGGAASGLRIDSQGRRQSLNVF